MLLSVTAFTGDVINVGVAAGAVPRRFRYTLIGSRSGRIGTPAMKPASRRGAIASVPDGAPGAPGRGRGAFLMGSASPGPAPKSGVAAVCKAVTPVVQPAAVPVTLISQPAPPRLASTRQALDAS